MENDRGGLKLRLSNQQAPEWPLCSGLGVSVEEGWELGRASPPMQAPAEAGLCGRGWDGGGPTVDLLGANGLSQVGAARVERNELAVGDKLLGTWHVTVRDSRMQRPPSLAWWLGGEL